MLSAHNTLLCMFQRLCTNFQDTGVLIFGGYVLSGHCNRQQISVKTQGVLIFGGVFIYGGFTVFCSRVIHRFVPKNGRVFQHYFISKANSKTPEQVFFSSQILLAEETKRTSLARLVFNLKAIEFGTFFAYFHLFRHLKVIRLKYAKTFLFSTSFQTKKKKNV